MKKFLKILGVIILVLIAALILTPIIFEDQIESELKKVINKNVNATVDWDELDLSLFRSFPDASLQLTDLKVINKAPFEGDTLVNSKEINLNLGLLQLLKSDPIKIDNISIDGALISVKVKEDGTANYDIAKDTGKVTETETSDEPSEMELALQSYAITNSTIIYDDQSAKTYLKLTDFEHKGSGDLEASKTTLQTQTNSLVTFIFDDVEYLSDNTIDLAADLEMDFDQMKFSFLENKVMINQLPLNFEGYVQMFDEYQDINVSFSTPTSSFKNFLGLVPKAYAGSLEGVDTSGDFELKGSIKGRVDDDNIPHINIKGFSENAKVKYADLPKSIDNIHVNVEIINDTGKVEDTYIDIKKMAFNIAQDYFKGQLKVSDLMNDMIVDFDVDGNINLANIEQAYPVDIEQDLNGLLKMQLAGRANVEQVSQENYRNLDINGRVSLNNFNYTDEAFPHELKINKTAIQFTKNQIRLQNLDLTTGQSDLNAKGELKNLIAFVFSKGELEGHFSAKSNNFVVSDFLVESTEEEQAESENKKEADKPSLTANNSKAAFKIPDFLNITLNFDAKKVNYDNINLNNVKGALSIKNEGVNLEKVNADIFGGKIFLDGLVSTKNDQPNFDVKLNLDLIDIKNTFEGLDILQNIAPIAEALTGQMNLKFNFNGLINKDLSLALNTLKGQLGADILNAEIHTEQSKLISGLSSKLENVNLSSKKLKDLSALLKFEDGKIITQPFDFNIEDIRVNVKGEQGFDKSINYNLDLDIPAKYLGKKLGGQIAKLSGQDLKDFKIDLPISLAGQYNSPKIKLNMKTAINDLKDQIIEEQKGKLKDKAKDKIQDLFGGRNNKDKDSTQTTQDSTRTKTKEEKKEESRKETKDKVKGALEGLFGKKDKDKEEKNEN
ncbi:MAG: AsmA family protein [Psychroflexus sp.]|nr:AsmA family protein [Psychroflexus sp.]MDN6309717.1 AsmA family protein [Psychroflexus sp.]